MYCDQNMRLITLSIFFSTNPFLYSTGDSKSPSSAVDRRKNPFSFNRPVTSNVSSDPDIAAQQKKSLVKKRSHVSIPLTFYWQLLHHYYFAKKLQSQTFLYLHFWLFFGKMKLAEMLLVKFDHLTQFH
jgi:hypothetical protein